MPGGDTFKLIIDKPNQETIFVDTSADMPIHQLKQRISEQTGISVPTFTLIAGGTDLDAEKTVGFYEIQPQAMVHMVIKAFGGR